MKLYHGTFENFYKSIILDEEIRPRFGINQGTDLIDVALNRFLDDLNIREGAIYLFDGIKYTSCYDYLFQIEVDKLNKNLLYVADFRISTDIYDAVMRGKNDKYIKALCEKYADSFMTYGAYLANKNKIEIPEFLYFGEIQVKDTNLLGLDELIDMI